LSFLPLLPHVDRRNWRFRKLWLGEFGLFGGIFKLGGLQSDHIRLLAFAFSVLFTLSVGIIFLA
jgi:hypothetical protein